MILLKLLLMTLVYPGGFALGSLLLRRLLLFVDPSVKDLIKPGLDVHDVGFWIGACEHFLIVTFVLMDEYTAIGLIFAAKEIVRSEKIREKPSYYLLGTLLSLSFAIFFGLLGRWGLQSLA